MSNGDSWIYAILGILAISGIVSAVFLIVDASEPVFESAKEGDTQAFGENISTFIIVVILVLFITIFGTVVFSWIKK